MQATVGHVCICQLVGPSPPPKKALWVASTPKILDGQDDEKALSPESNDQTLPCVAAHLL